MGVCASCLGFNRRPDPSSSERERLLRHDSSSRRQYGASNGQASTPAFDPEQLKRERDALERICAQTADNLIDITHSDSDAIAALGGTGTAKTTSDYARLFIEIFPVPTNLLPQSITSSGTAEPEPKTEQEWLKRIMERDPEDKSWDPNVVHEINKPLTFDFD